MIGFQPNQNYASYIATADEWNDMYIGENGILGTSSGYSSMSEAITSALLLWYGEYEYDTTIGVTYGAILGNPHVDSALIQYQIEKNIMSVNDFLTDDQVADYGVKTINSVTFGMNRKTRKFTATAKITLYNKQKITITT
jgi:hypothetical protein